MIDPYLMKPKIASSKKTRVTRAHCGTVATFRGRPVVAWVEKGHIHFRLHRDKGPDPKPVCLKDLYFQLTGYLEQAEMIPKNAA